MPDTKAIAPTIVNLSGTYMIDRSSALKAELWAAIVGSDRVLVSLSLAEDLDLACLQVLYSARRFARATGKELRFVGSVPSRIVERLSSCGFLHGSPQRAEDFEAVLQDF